MSSTIFVPDTGWRLMRVSAVAATLGSSQPRFRTDRDAGSVLRAKRPIRWPADQQAAAAQASAQTGYSPSAPPAAAAAPQPVAGRRVAGAARGAAAGKVISTHHQDVETDAAMEGGAKLGDR